MAFWAGIALAWLAGTAWQTGAATLLPASLYALGLLASAASAAVAWAWLRRRQRQGRRRPREGGLSVVSQAILMLAMAGLACSATGWRAVARMQQSVPPGWQGRDVAVTVEVQGLPRAAGGAALFDAAVLDWGRAGDGGGEGSGLPRKLAVRMPVADGAMPRAGQRWRLHVRLHEPDGPSNPGGFDPTLPYFDRGVRAVASVSTKAPRPEMTAPASGWRGWIDRQRQAIRDRIFARIPDAGQAGVLAGLSVGDQSAIERDDWDVFRKAGLGHVVSISGTHIAMLGWLAAWAARRLWSRWPAGVHRWPATDVALWAGVVFSALYALLAGWGVPAQRTVWMMGIVAVMRTGGRRWPWPLVWLGSAVILTLVDPWCIRQAGFWLSYVAVGVLMSSGMPAEGQPRGRRGGARDPVDGARAGGGAPGDDIAPAVVWRARLAARLPGAIQAVRSALADMVRAQWRVTQALLPLILVCFGQVSLVGFGANLFAIPFFTLAITPLALLGVAIGPSWQLGAWLIAHVMDVLGWITSTPYAMGDVPLMPLWMAVPAVLAGWCMALRMDWAWRLALLPFALGLLYLPQAWRLLPPPGEGQFQVLAVDIGQGTAVLVRTAHRALLFDTGPRAGDGSNAGDRILLPLLRALGIARLDMLMISHEDTDHVGGAEAVVRQVAVSRLRSSLDAAHPLRTMPGVDGWVIAHTACEAGQSWTWDGVRFDVLHPTREDLLRRAARPGRIAPNAVSCVLRVQAALPDKGGATGDADPGGAPSILLTGDIGQAEEAAIMARARASDGVAPGSLRATVLVSPHHGSRTSSSEGFLRAVRPRQIVIQAARRNRYGHPAPDVIARYEAMGLPWLATPDCGAYLWSSDGAEASPDAGLDGIRTGTGTGTGRHARPGMGGARKGQPAIGLCWRHAHRRHWHGAPR